MAGRIVLFGATGYTGGLTAQSLVRRGQRPLLAARSADKLSALAGELGGGIETALADISDPDSIQALLERGDVLISTVGPFTRWGAAAAEAAIAAGAHYLDSTGEAPFIRKVFQEYDTRAEAAGVGMLTAFGNDWVPGNLAGALALQRAGDRAARVDIGYFATGGGAGGGFSAGTRASTVSSMSETSFAWRDGRIVTERLGRKGRRFDLGGRPKDALSVGGSEHFGLPRVAPGLREVNVYLGWFGGMTRALRISSAVSAGVFVVPGTKRLFDAATARLVKGSGGGPDTEARAGSRSIYLAEVFDETGEQLAQVRLEGPDGYTITGDLLAWGAEQIAGGKLAGSGALAPVDGFGLDRLQEGCADLGIAEAG